MRPCIQAQSTWTGQILEKIQGMASNWSATSWKRKRLARVRDRDNKDMGQRERKQTKNVLQCAKRMYSRVIKIQTIPQIQNKASIIPTTTFSYFTSSTIELPVTAGNTQPTLSPRGAFGEPLLHVLWKWHRTSTPKGARTRIFVHNMWH